MLNMEDIPTDGKCPALNFNPKVHGGLLDAKRKREADSLANRGDLIGSSKLRQGDATDVLNGVFERGRRVPTSWLGILHTVLGHAQVGTVLSTDPPQDSGASSVLLQ